MLNRFRLDSQPVDLMGSKNMPERFRHEAVPYDGLARFASTGTSLIRDGLGRSERVIILAAGEKIDAVRDELGADAEDVTFVDTGRHGRNPGRITTMLHGFQSADDGRHSLGLNERVIAGRSAAAHGEAQFADSVLNGPTFRSWPMSVVCLYDTASLDEPGLTSMLRNHCFVRGRERNPHFDVDVAARTYATPLAPAPADAVRISAGGPDLARTRTFVRSRCATLAIAPDRTDDLVLAANEAVTNSVRYGGGTAALAVWFEDGSIVCEVADRGHIVDPLAGRFPPPPSATSGRGLWLVNHLCDLVQVRSAPGRTVVRMYVER